MVEYFLWAITCSKWHHNVTKKKKKCSVGLFSEFIVLTLNMEMLTECMKLVENTNTRIPLLIATSWCLSVVFKQILTQMSCLNWCLYSVSYDFSVKKVSNTQDNV